ncbi:MAG: hypothetical protein HRT71_13145 [Flavobacteriales bacterium]|nr:hypothetical protein [Flavobacteriales bacterium]
MANKNIHEIEFNDIGFVEKDGRKALIVFGKTQQTAKRLFEALKDGFNLRHTVERGGKYTIGLDVVNFGSTLMLETQLTRSDNPALQWLDNSSIGFLLVAYKDGMNTEMLEPAFSIISHTHPN